MSDRQRGTKAVDNHYYLPAPSVVGGLSFGFRELAADLLWVRTIAYFADHLTTDRDFRHLHRYLETVLVQDPRFKAVYRYGASMLTGIHGKDHAAACHKGASLLKQAVRYFPEYYPFALALGVLYLNELAVRGPPALRRRYRLEGAQWLRRAVLLGAPQPWLPLLAAQMYSKEGQRQMAIHHLKETLLVTRNPETRRQIISKLGHLRMQGAAERLRKESEQLRRAHSQGPLAFISIDLYAIMALPTAAPPSLEVVLGAPGVTGSP